MDLTIKVTPKCNGDVVLCRYYVSEDKETNHQIYNLYLFNGFNDIVDDYIEYLKKNVSIIIPASRNRVTRKVGGGIYYVQVKCTKNLKEDR